MPSRTKRSDRCAWTSSRCHWYGNRGCRGGHGGASAAGRRTPQDWAQEVARLLEGSSADCAKITLACDNLNTHTKGAFCAARELVRRVELGYAPHHGSWLHNLECELSATTRQSVAARRSGELSALQAAIAACSTATNARPRGVEWQRKVADARCKLKSVFPKMIL